MNIHATSPIIPSYLFAEVGFERVYGFPGDAAVEAAGISGELSAVRQRGSPVGVIHSHRSRCTLPHLVHLAMVLVKSEK